MRGRGLFAVVAAGLAVWSCDLAYDSEDPWSSAGDEAVLEHGEVAIDDVTETVFVARRSPAPPSCWWDCYSDEDVAARPCWLSAVRADADVAVRIADLTGLADLRMVFPRDGVLVLGERWERSSFRGDELRLYDRTTFAEIRRELVSDRRFIDPSVSPDGRWIASREGSSSSGSLALLDTATFASAVLRGGTVEAFEWLPGGARLMAVVVYDVSCFIGCTTGSDPRIRILAWDVDALGATGFLRDADGLWVGAEVDVTVPIRAPESSEAIWAMQPSLAVAPDGGLAAVAYYLSLYDESGFHPSEEGLLLVDPETGAFERMGGIGLVTGFTPDGDTLVGKRCFAFPGGTPPTACSLQLVDRETRAVASVELPGDGIGSIFALPDGRRLVTSLWGVDDGSGTTLPRSLLVYDLDLRRLVTAAGPPVSLYEFTFRTAKNEIWLLDRGLFRFDVPAGFVQPVPLDWSPTSIGHLPRNDLLVVSARGARIDYVDPDTGETVRSVRVPDPPPATR